MITKDKIKIYDSFAGNEDQYLRSANADLSSDEWHLITSIYQDLELISKGLSALSFNQTFFTTLKENTDPEGFSIFTNKIIAYQEFQNIARILEWIRIYTPPTADTVWAGFDSAEEFLKELETDIENIRLCDNETLKKLNIEFIATSTYQELSLSNGWGNEYIGLSTEFDQCYTQITSKRLRSTKSKTILSWLKELFKS